MENISVEFLNVRIELIENFLRNGRWNSAGISQTVCEKCFLNDIPWFYRGIPQRNSAKKFQVPYRIHTKIFNKINGGLPVSDPWINSWRNPQKILPICASIYGEICSGISEEIHDDISG